MPSHPLVLAEAVQVRLHWNLNGVECFNVMHARVGGGYTNSQAHATALGAAIKTTFDTSGLKDLITVDSALNAIGIRNLRVANEVEFLDATAAVPGVNTGDNLPNQLAIVCTLRTSKAGKRYRGRVYFSGFCEDSNTAAGKIVAGTMTAVEAFMAGVKSNMGTEGLTLAVLSRPTYSLIDPFGPIWEGALTNVDTQLVRDNQWDTQRRRRD